MNIDSIKKSLYLLIKSKKTSICLIFSTVSSEETCQQLKISKKFDPRRLGVSNFSTTCNVIDFIS